jgi:hypothetical protein
MSMRKISRTYQAVVRCDTGDVAEICVSGGHSCVNEAFKHCWMFARGVAFGGYSGVVLLRVDKVTEKHEGGQDTVLATDVEIAKAFLARDKQLDNLEAPYLTGADAMLLNRIFHGVA